MKYYTNKLFHPYSFSSTDTLSGEPVKKYNPLPELSELEQWDNQTKALLEKYPGHWYDAVDRGSQTIAKVPFLPYDEYINTMPPYKTYAIMDKAYGFQTTPMLGRLKEIIENVETEKDYTGSISLHDDNTISCNSVSGMLVIKAGSISDEEEVVFEIEVQDHEKGSVHILNYGKTPGTTTLNKNQSVKYRLFRRGVEDGVVNITFAGDFTGKMKLIINQHIGLPLGAKDVDFLVDESGAYFHSPIAYTGAEDGWPGFTAPLTRFDYDRPDLSMYRTIHLAVKADAITDGKAYRLMNLPDPVSPDQDWYSAGLEITLETFRNGSNRAIAVRSKQEYHTGENGGLPPAIKPGFGNWSYDTSFTTSSVPEEAKVKQLMIISFVCFIHPNLATNDSAPIMWMRVDGANVGESSRGWNAHEMPDGTKRGFGPHRVGFAMGYSGRPGADEQHEIAIREMFTHAGLPTRAEYDAIHQALREKHQYIADYRKANPTPTE